MAIDNQTIQTAIFPGLTDYIDSKTCATLYGRSKKTKDREYSLTYLVGFQ